MHFARWPSPRILGLDSVFDYSFSTMMNISPVKLFYRLSGAISLPVRTKITSNQVHVSGDPFATCVSRKRVVDNPNMPVFDRMQNLRWAKWSMLRDVKRRIISSDYWQERLNLRNIEKAKTLPSIVREMAAEERNSHPQTARWTGHTNRCSITARSRGKVKQYRLSRMFWRDMADHGRISGAIRSKWG